MVLLHGRYKNEQEIEQLSRNQKVTMIKLRHHNRKTCFDTILMQLKYSKIKINKKYGKERNYYIGLIELKHNKNKGLIGDPLTQD